MEHELENITFYAQNHIAPLALCHNPAPVSDKPPGAPASVKPVYFCDSTKFQWQPVYLDLCAPPSGVAHVNVVAVGATVSSHYSDGQAGKAGWTVIPGLLGICQRLHWRLPKRHPLIITIKASPQRHFRRIVTSFGLKCKCINRHFKPRL